MPYPSSGIPTYTGPSSVYPSGSPGPLESRGLSQTRGETPGAIAGDLKSLLAAGGFSDHGDGIGVHADRQA